MSPRWIRSSTAGSPLVADAREAIDALDRELADYAVAPGYRDEVVRLARQWDDTVGAAYRVDDDSAGSTRAR